MLKNEWRSLSYKPMGFDIVTFVDASAQRYGAISYNVNTGSVKVVSVPWEDSFSDRHSTKAEPEALLRVLYRFATPAQQGQSDHLPRMLFLTDSVTAKKSMTSGFSPSSPHQHHCASLPGIVPLQHEPLLRVRSWPLQSGRCPEQRPSTSGSRGYR